MVFLLKKTPGTETLERLLRSEHDLSEEEYFSGVFCRFCGNLVTTLEQMLSKQGSHRHVFTNPAGLTFEIVLYREAPGCVNVTEPTFEHTWFSGYAWSVSVCSKCMNHLGWFYTGPEGDHFYGLILERLVEGPPEI